MKHGRDVEVGDKIVLDGGLYFDCCLMPAGEGDIESHYECHHCGHVDAELRVLDTEYVTITYIDPDETVYERLCPLDETDRGKLGTINLEPDKEYMEWL